MHATLTPKGNAKFAVLWCLVLAASGFLSSSFPPLVPAAFGVVGAIAGWLQGLAIRSNTKPFLAAPSALQVRAALVATKPGKVAVYLVWAVFLVLVGALVYTGPSASAFTGLAGYSAFAFVREVASMPALIALSREAS